MARFFDGVDDRITLSLGNLGFAFGPGTLAAICQRGSDTTIDAIFSAGASSAAGFSLHIAANDIITFTVNNSAKTAPAGIDTVLSTDGWVLIAVTKASGNVVERFHRYEFATNVWQHADGSTNVNSSAPVTEANIGTGYAGINPYHGDIAVVGAYDVVLTDSQIESLAFDLNSWFQVQPRGLWVLDQDATTQKVNDLSGGGAKESAIVGTAVSTSSVPIFSYGAPVDLVQAITANIATGALAVVLTLSGTGTVVSGPVTGNGAITLQPTTSGTARQVNSGTGSVSVRPSLSGTGKQTNTGSGSTTVSPALSGTGKQVNSGTGTITIPFNVSGSGKQTNSGTGLITIRPALSGAGSQANSGSGSTTVPVSLSGSGKQTNSGSGATTVQPTLSGTGKQINTGSGSTTVAPSLSGTGSAGQQPGTGSITVVPVLSGTGTQVNSGSGALSVTISTQGQGLAGAIGQGGISFSPSVSGSGKQVNSGSGSIVIVPSLSGVGVSILPISGTGAIQVPISLSGTGTNISAYIRLTEPDGLIDIEAPVTLVEIATPVSLKDILTAVQLLDPNLTVTLKDVESAVNLIDITAPIKLIDAG